jgi:hypothetical protein
VLPGSKSLIVKGSVTWSFHPPVLEREAHAQLVDGAHQAVARVVVVEVEPALVAADVAHARRHAACGPREKDLEMCLYKTGWASLFFYGNASTCGWPILTAFWGLSGASL